MLVFNAIFSSPLVEVFGILLTVAMIIGLIVEEGKLGHSQFNPQKSWLFSFLSLFDWKTLRSLGSMTFGDVTSVQMKEVVLPKVKCSLHHQHVHRM